MASKSRKPTTKIPKGCWLELVMESGEIIIPTDRPANQAELNYLLKRKYMNTPGLKYARTHVSGKTLENFEIVLLEGRKQIMTTSVTEVFRSFDDFESTYNELVKTDKVRVYEYPWDSKEDRLTMVQYEIPFSIVACGHQTSRFEDMEGNPQEEFWYDIRFHTDTPNYESAATIKHIGATLKLRLNTSGKNIKKRTIQQDYIKERIEAGTAVAVLALGGPSGKEYVFREVTAS